MKNLSFRSGLLGGGAALAAAAIGVAVLVSVPSSETRSNTPSQAEPAAVPVSVAVVEPREIALWDEFSGRLEAVERVEVRSRVAGAIKAVHFREGSLVREGDLLITIDPDPYAAEVERSKAQVLAAEARLTLAQKDQDRARRLQQANSGAISESSSTSASTPIARPRATCRPPGPRCRRHSSTSTTRRCVRRSQAASASSRSPSAIWWRPGRPLRF